jgi:chemotaxis response regulator CheB
MPGAAVHTGLCSGVLPIDDIAPKVIKLMNGERS